jgi:CO/xanthine dehydrogenase FAD-binding subunit
MKGSVTRCRLFTPNSLREALGMLRDEGPLTPMAGCTDLYVALNLGTLAGTRFLNLWRLEALRRIELRRIETSGAEGDLLSIGALATYTDIIRSAAVRRRIPMLADAAREIGGVQIQNRGTIGGNVANASPAGDTLPVLAAADATVVLRSSGGERRVAFTRFYTGYRQTVRRPDELITALEIPRLRGRQWFRKVGTRAAQAISKVVMAGVAGDVPRVAIGSVAPTVLRLTRTEAAIARGASIDDVERTFIAEIAPIDDVRSTAEYRRRVAARLLARMLS